MAQQIIRPKPASSVKRQPSLEDPIPDLIEDVRAELKYWQDRNITNGPNSPDADGVMKRILRLRAETGEFDKFMSTPNSAAQPGSSVGASAPTDNLGSPFAPSDVPAPRDPWAEASAASSVATPNPLSSDQGPADPFSNSSGGRSAPPESFSGGSLASSFKYGIPSPNQAPADPFLDSTVYASSSSGSVAAARGTRPSHLSHWRIAAGCVHAARGRRLLDAPPGPGSFL